MRKTEEFFLGGGHNLNVKASQSVELIESLTLIGESNETVQLDVRITVDLNQVPEKYHEIFLNMLTSRYYGKVSYGNNPFSRCQPKKPKKWWQFWKES